MSGFRCVVLISVVLCYFCFEACFQCIATFFCFVVLIFLCCALFLFCCANFIVFLLVSIVIWLSFWCANLVVLRLVSIVLWLVSFLFCEFCCVSACFHCDMTCFCFVVLISLCYGLSPSYCDLFLFCCANFIVLRLVSIVLCQFHCVASFFHCDSTCFCFVVLILLCFHCIVLRLASIVFFRFHCVKLI